jgi:hypothetical protein
MDYDISNVIKNIDRRFDVEYDISLVIKNSHRYFEFIILHNPHL